MLSSISGREPIQTQGPLRFTLDTPRTPPGMGVSVTPPGGSLGPGGAVADCFTQLPLPAGLLSPPAVRPHPAGGQDPPASCPAPHRAELAEPIPAVGVLRAPMCPDSLCLVQTLNSCCPLSPLRAGRDGAVSEFYFCTSTSIIHLAVPTLRNDSLILPGTMVGSSHQGGSEESHWRLCDHPEIGQ